MNGRPGPCWIDIPIDVQGSFVIEDYQANGGGTGNPGINFSVIENGFMVENPKANSTCGCGESYSI